MICFEAIECGADADDDEDDDPALKCSTCSLVAHALCYGLSTAPPRGRRWSCQQCVQKRKDPSQQKQQQCLACPSTLPGMKQTSDGKRWIHILCALHIPEAFFVEPETRDRVDVSAVAPRRFTMRCDVCKTKGGGGGVCIQCSYGKCTRAFHVMCGMLDAAHKVEMREDEEGEVFFHAFCAAHASRSHEVATNNSDPAKRRKMLERRNASSASASSSSSSSDSSSSSTSASKRKSIAASSKSSHTKDSSPSGCSGNSRLKHSGNSDASAASAAASGSDSSAGSGSGSSIVYPGQCAHLVLCGTSLAPDQQALLLAFVQLLGGRVDAEFTDECTHVVTKATAATGLVLAARPLKYFYGVLGGKWVVSFECASGQEGGPGASSILNSLSHRFHLPVDFLFFDLALSGACVFSFTFTLSLSEYWPHHDARGGAVHCRQVQGRRARLPSARRSDRVGRAGSRAPCEGLAQGMRAVLRFLFARHRMICINGILYACHAEFHVYPPLCAPANVV
jgi:hypothetical protein